MSRVYRVEIEGVDGDLGRAREYIQVESNTKRAAVKQAWRRCSLHKPSHVVGVMFVGDSEAFRDRGIIGRWGVSGVDAHGRTAEMIARERGR